jgi:hypothetical protein
MFRFLMLNGIFFFSLFFVAFFWFSSAVCAPGLIVCLDNLIIAEFVGAIGFKFGLCQVVKSIDAAKTVP